MLVPHVFQQGLLGEDLAGVHHEVPEQRELLGGQVQRPTAPAGRVTGRVQLEVTHDEHRGGGGRLTSQQRTHPSQQLGEGERLDEVVVGAVVEPGHPVLEGVAGGEHQHPWRRVEPEVGADLAAHLAPVDAGHGDVEADQVVARSP